MEHTIPLPAFKVGDWVRVSVVKKVFERGYHANWSYQPYKINKVMMGNPVLYQLKERDGTPLTGSFYDSELQHTSVPDVGFVDKLLEHRGKGKKKQSLVSWRGVDKKYASWIDDDKITTL